MKLEELKAKKAEIEKQIKEEEERLRDVRVQEATEHVENLSEDTKSLILSLLEHDRTSCSDEFPINGWGSRDGGCRCKKCALMELFNGSFVGEIDFSFEVNVFPVN